MKTTFKQKVGTGIITLLFLFIACKKEENKGITDSPQRKTNLSAVVLFAVGDVRIGDKKIKTGDLISENETVKTGAKSSCDVQIKDSDAGIVIRVKSESVFELKMTTVNGKPTPSTMINIGNAMVNVSGKLKSNEEFQIVTPTSTAGVRGTKFEVNVVKDGSTTVSVSEGKVATRARIEEVDTLPQEIREKSQTIISLNESLDAKEEIIEAGYKTSVTKDQTNKILKSNGLDIAINKTQINQNAKLSPDEVQKAINILDENSGKTTDLNTQSKALEEKAAIKVEKIPSTELQQKLKEFSELIAIEKQKLDSNESLSLAIKERNGKNEEILIQRMETLTGKTVQTITLKSGRKLKGIIFEEGPNLFVITPNGQEAISQEEIEEVNF